MAQRTYDPDNWLDSMLHAIEDYVSSYFNGDVYQVEMSFPDTSNITKETPLDKILIHFEIDDEDSTPMGFGSPGVPVYDEDAGTEVIQGAQPHIVNFDVGVWASAEMGGETLRARTMQKLKDLFTQPQLRQQFKDATGGVKIVSFQGGRNLLDRINDILVWRAADMTLRVRVVSRYTPDTPVLVPSDGFDINLSLTIDDDKPV